MDNWRWLTCGNAYRLQNKPKRAITNYGFPEEQNREPSISEMEDPDVCNLFALQYS